MIILREAISSWLKQCLLFCNVMRMLPANDVVVYLERGSMQRLHAYVRTAAKDPQKKVECTFCVHVCMH